MGVACDFCITNTHEYTFGIFNLCASCFHYYLDDDESNFDSDYDSDDEASEASTIVT